MATILPVGVKTAIASNTYVLGNGGDGGQAGGFLVQIKDTGSLSATVDVKAQCWGINVLGDTASYVPISYRKGYLNGSVGDWSYVSTQITTDSLIYIPAVGMAVALVVALTSGTGTIYAQPVQGPAPF